MRIDKSYAKLLAQGNLPKKAFLTLEELRSAVKAQIGKAPSRATISYWRKKGLIAPPILERFMDRKGSRGVYTTTTIYTILRIMHFTESGNKKLDVLKEKFEKEKWVDKHRRSALEHAKELLKKVIGRNDIGLLKDAVKLYERLYFAADKEQIQVYEALLIRKATEK